MNQKHSQHQYPAMRNRVLPKRPTSGLTAPTAIETAVIKTAPSLRNKRVAVINATTPWLTQYAVNAGADAVIGISQHRHQIDTARHQADSAQLRYQLLPPNRWALLGGTYDILVARVTSNTELTGAAAASGIIDAKHGCVIIINEGLNVATIRRVLTDPLECNGRAWNNTQTTGSLLAFRPQR
ncbi:hypothetical protein [Lacticaseibacillus thailandensis]|uniref:Uncharacterized protein n=1 Tax=Lacticaseibacillus thailandensis DSM 22698 = JCM 13996 TaxID=1423810 RepID=A0A0R2C6S6_9LACO|nr:hypothetical protein [Lacticaseibacillus thailandensis]KRM87336.1 hypothetical protein FD19_GL000836 [Lacticaseibacillus thailandensis DSM 22698 = JCM 13996]